MKHSWLVAGLLAAARARAGPVDQPATSDDHTAAEVENAPLPGQESGRADSGEHDSTLRNIGQGVLVVPKVLFEAVFVPVHGSLQAYDRYTRRSGPDRLSLEDTGTSSITPLLYVDNVYGVTLGGRFARGNAFAHDEQLEMSIAFGGKTVGSLGLAMSSGDLLGPITSLELAGDLENDPADLYFGIGNNSDAIETRYRQLMVSSSLRLEVLAASDFHVRGVGTFTNASYGVSDKGPPIDVVYGPRMLTGFTGTRNLYGEVGVAYDSRRTTSTLAQRGLLLDAFAGFVNQLEAGSNYWRYGGEALYFVPLGAGRTLATGLHLESVTGSVMDVAFTQLPHLGGDTLLRGYAPGRFRDRVALVGSAEYFWDIGTFLRASVFADSGRVYSSMEDLTFDDLRLGFGGSLQLLVRREFVASATIASSIDGGVFVNFVFDPSDEDEP